MSVTSPTVVAALSFVYPGLGQLAAGSTAARRRGLVFALPATAILVLLLVLASLGTHEVLELLVRPEVLGLLLAVNAIAAVIHVAAIVDAYRTPTAVPAGRGGGSDVAAAPAHRRTFDRVVVLALLAVTLAGHGAIGYLGARGAGALDAIFGPGGAWVIPDPSFGPSPTPTTSPSASPSREPSPTPSAEPSASPSPSPTPPPTPSPTPAPAWAEDGRLDLLLIGSDAGPDRWMLRTDTMIVLSVDVATGRAALFGVPRNLVGVPLPPESAGAFPDGRFPGLLNALYVYAMGHGGSFPGGDARGFRAVTGAVQELVGVRLDGAVVVNLRGFVQLVDALGGLWIDVPARLVDNRYPLEDGSKSVRVVIEAGCQHLGGQLALAYARSRHQDSDYGRMARQQLVLLALRRQVDPIALLPRVPELLTIAEDNLWTTIEVAELPALVDLAARVAADRVATITFVPPRYPSHLTTAEIDAIRSVVRTIFDGPAPTPEPSAAPSPTGPGCGG
ncbi:MAG TPA: LCP family protein [Candidatus Limnocylindrales bacterium]|nr:LCP family protein [Candidatus Limnocylindrales bacterium]